MGRFKETAQESYETYLMPKDILFQKRKKLGNLKCDVFYFQPNVHIYVKI